MSLWLALWALRAGIILSNVVLSRRPQLHHHGDDAPAAQGDPRLGAAGLARLADFVCETMLQNATANKLNNCVENFMERPIDNTIPGTSHLKEFSYHCRGLDTITLEPGSGGEWELALLLEENNDTTLEVTEVDFAEVKIILTKSGNYLTFENLTSTAWYRAWVTPLHHTGRRQGPWRKSRLMQSIRGSRPDLQPLPVTEFNAPTHYQYMEQDQYGGGNLKRGLSADFSWKRAEDDSCHYTFYYYCKNNLAEDPVSFGPEDQLTATVHWLPFNSTCTVTVENLYSDGNSDHLTLSEFHVRTPSCFEAAGTTHCPPVKPSLVTTRATPTGYRTEEGSPKYDVTVTWSTPAVLPEAYSITIMDIKTDVSSKTVVDGNATAAIFEDAPVTGEYHAVVTAVSAEGNTTSNVAHGDAKPAKESPVAYEAAWAAACAGAALALLVVLCLWRRARLQHMRRHVNFEELEQKAAIEVYIDSGTSLTEDVFELNSDNVLLFEILGEGAFGVVRKGRLPDRGKEVAVKMLKDLPSQEDVRQFRQEMEVMKSVGEHPHVVSLLGCVTTSRRMMIVVEYCARGDLLNYLRCAWDVMSSKRHHKLLHEDTEFSDKFKPDPKEREVNNHRNLIVNKLYDLQGICETELTAVDLLSFCRQIAMGMEFLASNRVVHRDLAARNVLVCADKTVKIADFGLSRDVYQNNQYKKTGSGKLPIKWMALESLTHQLYTTQSDVWSFGIVMWEAVTLGGAPYPGMSAARLPRLLRAGYRMPRPHNCSREIYDIMLSCWRTRPKERPTFAELHHRLDQLLGGICYEEYLNLDLMDYKDIEECRKVPPDKLTKYCGIITRDRKSQSQATPRLNIYEKYMKPVNAIWRSQHTIPNLNHYSVMPKHPTPQSTDLNNITHLITDPMVRR